MHSSFPFPCRSPLDHKSWLFTFCFTNPSSNPLDTPFAPLSLHLCLLPHLSCSIFRQLNDGFDDDADDAIARLRGVHDCRASTWLRIDCTILCGDVRDTSPNSAILHPWPGVRSTCCRSRRIVRLHGLVATTMHLAPEQRKRSQSSGGGGIGTKAKGEQPYITATAIAMQEAVSVTASLFCSFLVCMSMSQEG